jgi:hypothetical protein
MKLLFGPSVDRLFGLGGQVVESRGLVEEICSDCGPVDRACGPG